VIALWIACASDPHDRTPAGGPGSELPPDEEARDSGTPAVEPTEPLVPTLVTWSASFGWDDGPIAVGTEYGTIEPEIVVTLGGDAWEGASFDPARPDLSCEVAYPLVDPGPAAWTEGEARLWYGLDAGPASRSTCPDDVLSAAPWGVAIGDLSPTAAAFADYYLAGSVLASTFGGRMRAGDQVVADDDVYGRAWELDADGALRVDAAGAATAIEVDRLFVDGALARGWYRLESMYIWPFEP
jgi:hypothetical protein